MYMYFFRFSITDDSLITSQRAGAAGWLRRRFRATAAGAQQRSTLFSSVPAHTHAGNKARLSTQWSPRVPIGFLAGGLARGAELHGPFGVRMSRFGNLMLAAVFATLLATAPARNLIPVLLSRTGRLQQDSGPSTFRAPPRPEILRAFCTQGPLIFQGSLGLDRLTGSTAPPRWLLIIRAPSMPSLVVAAKSRL